jgi:6-phosphogluconolactonase
MLAFVSMFGPPEEAGIQAFHVDVETGSLTPAKETLAGGQTFFLAIAPDCRTLYSVRAEHFGGQNHEEIVAWRIRGRDGLLEEINRQSTCGTASCFLSLDVAGRTLLVANYTTGSVAALPVKKDGSLGKVASFYEHEGASVHPDRQASAPAPCR